MIKLKNLFLFTLLIIAQPIHSTWSNGFIPQVKIPNYIINHKRFAGALCFFGLVIPALLFIIYKKYSNQKETIQKKSVRGVKKRKKLTEKEKKKLDNNLLEAAMENKLEEVKQLLEKGADPNKKDEPGNISLHYAVIEGNIEIARLLLANNANISEKNKDDRTMLDMAATGGHIEMVKFLLDRGVDIDEKGEGGSTALYGATVMDKREMVELLLDKGAKPNIPNEYGFAPLHTAVGHGEKIISENLINKGAEVNQQSKNGSTPLHRAVEHPSWDTPADIKMVKFLVENGADPTIKNEAGFAPIHYAEPNSEIAKFLK